MWKITIPPGDTHSYRSSRPANRFPIFPLNYSAIQHTNQQPPKHQSNASNIQQTRPIYNVVWCHQLKHTESRWQGYLISQKYNLLNKHPKQQQNKLSPQAKPRINRTINALANSNHSKQASPLHGLTYAQAAKHGTSLHQNQLDKHAYINLCRLSLCQMF